MPESASAVQRQAAAVSEGMTTVCRSRSGAATAARRAQDGLTLCPWEERAARGRRPSLVPPLVAQPAYRGDSSYCFLGKRRHLIENVAEHENAPTEHCH
ncbi:hypothetical protein OG393_22630 [Streptomyces sp. NBC_01216]|uniref:hypothetical protein n=1 Tax=Streptomyces sp. NBC_01216 TaxID=2903778 RepID=UPI002E15F470|nr:hypothetical protein OG393_22630 [Streptomyces sp. NBC_01216]